ncbi:energy transducer TonB [Chitinophaga sp.]|uniref:energy transducer TonB n=1 Tax=Chitinophaga sp. TaxID=1869181 RepID=UPI002F93E4AE
MSDKRPHIKPEELAGLIRQYLAGELDDKAMHALERQALDDPFLADALEGYAGHAPEQQGQQADLVSRLEARVAPKAGKVRTMYYRWAAAAAILLVMFSAGWFLWDQQRSTPPLASVPIPAPAPVADSLPQQESASAPALADADHLTKKVLPPIPAQPNSNKLKEEQATLSPADDAAVAPAKDVAASGKLEYRSVAPPAAAAPAPANKPLETATAVAAERSADAQHGYFVTPPPLAKKQEADKVTWANPTLAGNADSQNKSLSEVVVVYGAQQNNAKQSKMSIRGLSGSNAADSVSNIATALQGKAAGVSVTTDNHPEEEMVYREPAPVTGQTAFDNYLRTKTVNPDNKYTGTVRVSFTVMPDGSLQEFKILHHLNDACDAEAIRVIKEGPAWIPASDRKPAKVKVKVKFTVEKD